MNTTGTCDAGYGGDEECTICPKGRYKSEPGPGDCSYCEEGTTTDGEGKTSIDDCSKFTITSKLDPH